MEIVQIISTHKRARGRMTDRGTITPASPIAHGNKRVMAIMRDRGALVTRHIDVKK